MGVHHGAEHPLPVATWSFSATDDVGANARRISAGLVAAAAAGARVMATPECCLTGYPGAAMEGIGAVPWPIVMEQERALSAQARNLGLVLVLGTMSRAHDGICRNQALVGTAGRGRRIDKRCLTPVDRRHFVPGATNALVNVDGWRIGIAICFDIRFHDVFSDLAGADLFLVIAHMAGPDPDPGTKAQVIPALCSARAAEFATPLVLANTADADRYLDSGVWDARGVQVARRSRGLLTTLVRPRASFDPWYGDLRREALARRRRRPVSGPDLPRTGRR